MLNFTIWQEIILTIKQNKLRTFLTGFSIAWGIFMLMILLGAGNGLKNGVSGNFSGDTLNTGRMFGGVTSLPYNGLSKGRWIEFDDDDVQMLETEFSAISSVMPSISKYLTGVYKSQTASIELQSAFALSQLLEDVTMLSGRFINDNDLVRQNKVIVLDQTTATTLFKEEDPLNKFVNINNINFLVVGVKAKGMRNTSSAFVPFTTLKLLYNVTTYNSLDLIYEGINNEEDFEDLSTQIRKKIGVSQQFSPDDYGAVYLYSSTVNYEQTQKIFGAITAFIWIIGIGTLMAGIVGVSNIMLITVKDRTKEFGIRRAIGATPYDVIKLIVMESLMITLFFGYLGMCIGVLVTEAVGKVLEKLNQGEEFAVFTNPTVDLSIAISATLVLVVAGIFAGYIPARKAAKIKPIEAIRYE